MHGSLLGRGTADHDFSGGSARVKSNRMETLGMTRLVPVNGAQMPVSEADTKEEADAVPIHAGTWNRVQDSPATTPGSG